VYYICTFFSIKKVKKKIKKIFPKPLTNAASRAIIKAQRGGVPREDREPRGQGADRTGSPRENKPSKKNKKSA
jgi:hypothetical protein